MTQYCIETFACCQKGHETSILGSLRLPALELKTKDERCFYPMRENYSIQKRREKETNCQGMRERPTRGIQHMKNEECRC